MLRPRLRIPLRPGALLTPAFSSSATTSAALRPMACRARAMHSLTPLTYDLNGEVRTTGLGKLLSVTAYNIAWYQYQSHLLAKLNGLIADTDYQSRHVKDIMLSTARDPAEASTFNYASMIHNNHFFFKNLSPTPDVPMPDPLRHAFEASFGSLETLRQEMVYTAAAMFGPGFVWLVRTSHPGMPHAFKVLTTYAAGSPYPAAHWRRQDTDMNTAAGANSEAAIAKSRGWFANSAAGAGNPNVNNPADAYAPGGISLQPILCLNTWEHVWLWDYGFGTNDPSQGKLGFAERWWKYINWETVLQDANINRKQMSTDVDGGSAGATGGASASRGGGAQPGTAPAQ
ncbi:Manganese/iron superoxide dismutase [Chaetomium sp. MPI-SDFR-AT-0129]|nr:Manganese/iron superoxide dismutase [Chaetomium sp. MPI-SDFR-AT-0129]